MVPAALRAVFLKMPASPLGAKLNARPQDIIFTSGATESNALALHALAQGRPILIGATEHDAIRAARPWRNDHPGR